MKSLNWLENVETYKIYGALTLPFLNKDFVYNKVLTDLKNKQKNINSAHFLTS